VSGRRATTVTSGCALIDGEVRATWLFNKIASACPTGTVEAFAGGTEARQQVEAVRSAAATPKTPRREPRSLRVLSLERVIR
jgi:hypothetical protein